MNFSSFEEFHKKWLDLLVIGKTIEQNNKKYHIIGMTLTNKAAELYIIEPYTKPESKNKKGVYNQRRILKEQEEQEYRYLHCSDFSIANEHFKTQSSIGGPLNPDDYGTIQLFFDMLRAGWTVPDWLKNTDWDNLLLLTLQLNTTNIKKLPAYTFGMPITITHEPNFIRHTVEKTITLNIGKSSSFYFFDCCNDKVWCYINKITLIDVWENTEEKFNDPKLIEKFSPEQLEQAKKCSYNTLKQTCPKGMCYIGIEYECSKDLTLSFYSKQFLASRPETHSGSSSFFRMRLKPDKKTGAHNLPLKGCVIHTPVSPDTTKIPAELFLYFEKVDPWIETI